MRVGSGATCASGAPVSVSCRPNSLRTSAFSWVESAIGRLLRVVGCFRPVAGPGGAGAATVRGPQSRPNGQFTRPSPLLLIPCAILRAGHAEDAAGFGDVEVHPLDEGFDAVELLHAAEAFHEIDGARQAVEVGGAGDDERLGGAGGVAEGDVGAHGDGRRVGYADFDVAVGVAVGAFGAFGGGEPGGVDAVGGDGEAVREVDVGRREAELRSPAALAVDDFAGDAVGPAE